ncbi:hypothetical protein Tco_0255377 [Tanacetum coccineum]
MAQHVIPAAQLVPQYKPIRRCNNYMVLQSIPCSPECKIVGLILLDHYLSHALTLTADVPAVYLQQFWRTVSKVPDTEDTIKFMLDTQQFIYIVDMFRDTLYLPVETPENPFVAPANIHTIEAFMNRVGYQGVVDKVSAFFTKNLAQPWQTMFKDFMNNVFQKKEAIQYLRFIKLIVADLMKKFPNIPKRLEEDYHSIKDDVPLIKETNDFKEYKTVFIKVDVPMNQPQPVVSTQGIHRITPRAHRSPTVSASPSDTKKRQQIKGKSSSPRKSLKITIKQYQLVEKDDDDSKDRIELGSHKDNPEVVDDDDDNKREKKDDEMGSLEIRNEETETTIPTPLRALRRMCMHQGYMIQDMERKCVTTAKFWETHNKIDDILHEVVSQIAENVTNNLIEANLKPCIVNITIEDRDAFHSEIKRNLQDRADDIALWEALRHDDAPPEGEKRVKRSKKSKRSKSAREENVIVEDEVIPEDVTPELIAESQNVDKRVPTIFDHARMKATLKDSLSNMSRNAEEYAYHLEQSTSFMENQIYGNTKEKKYILSLHKIHAEEFPEPNLEEKLNRWVQKEFKTFNEDARLSIQHWKDSWHKRVYKQNQKKVRKNPEDYYSNHKITEVVRIITDQPLRLDFMEQILVMRANDKPDSFSEADFKCLNKNDIEDLYYLCRSKEIDNRKVKLMNSLITYIRSFVIWETVYDFQLGIESYQIKVNLTAPTLTFHDEKRVMYLEEIVKFCDATLEKVLNEVKLRMFESKFLKKPPLLGELDQDIMKAYEREISKRLSHRQQMRRWESFVNGRPILPTMKRL